MAQEYARRWLALEPWQETAHRRLMFLLARNGQRSAALKQYKICCRALAKGLGVEPAAKTTRLYERIKSEERATQPETAAPLPPCPYRGLAPFTEADAPFFFGREDFVEQLIETVAQHPLAAVVGPSGSGKSSVVLAGLLPRLRQDDTLPGQASSFIIVSFRPGRRPWRALASALTPLLEANSSETDRILEIDKLGEGLASGTLYLSDVAARILEKTPASNRNKRLLLVIDQFEELYTLCAEPDVRQHFLEALLTTAADREFQPPLCRLVLTLRADFMGQALAYRPLADALQQGVLLLGPMTQRELRHAIQEPARRQGVGMEAELVDYLLDDVGQEPGNLPLLEFALTSLWENQAETGGDLRLEACQALGGVQGALIHYADNVYARLTPAEQEQARRVLLQMAQPGIGTEDTRRPAARAELDERGWTIAQHLADVRLAVTGQDAAGQEIVEIAHEALIQRWGQLRAWLDEARAFRAWQERLRLAIAQWEASDRDEGGLLRGALLLQAGAWAKTHSGDLTTTEYEFIEAGAKLRDQKLQQAESQRQRELEQARSLAESERRQAEIERKAGNRLRWLAAGLAIILLVAVGAALLARQQRQAAEQARQEADRAAEISQSLNLATNAQLALSQNNTDLALALALAANRLDNPPAQARLMLAEAAYAPGTRRLFAGHSGPVQDVAISPDQKTALSASADKTLILWDISARLNTGMETGQALRTFTGHTGAVNDVAISPDGKTALSASADQTLILWDISARLKTGVESGDIIRRFSGHTAAVVSLAISPDGRMALSGAANGDVILWNLNTGQIIYQLAGYDDTIESVQTGQGHVGVVWGVAFSPDGQTAYSASDDESVVRWNLDEPDISFQSLRVEPGSGVFSLAVSSDGGAVLTGLLDSRITQSNAATGEPELHLLGHTGRILALAVSSDGRTALSGSADGTLRLWNLRHGAQLRHLVNEESVITSSYVNLAATSVDLSPDGRLGLTGHWNGEMSLWDYETGAVVRPLTGHTEMLFGGTLFGPAGQTILSGSGDIFAQAKDNTVRVWAVETGQELQRFEGHTDKLWDIDVSADGRFVASGSHDGTLRLWDLQSGQGEILLDVSPQAVRSVAFSPDSKTILAGLGKGSSKTPDYDLRLIETATGREVRRLAGHQEMVGDVAFSPDGRLAVSGGSAVLILWDMETGQAIRHLAGHIGQILTVAFSPDGRMVASGSQNKTVIVWDTAGGIPLRRFPDHGGPVVDLTFTPDGRSLLTAAAEDGIREWRIDASQENLLTWIERNRYAPELTCEQRDQYQVQPLCRETR